jgi:arginine/serine-rich splicing factor 4/5/6
MEMVSFSAHKYAIEHSINPSLPSDAIVKLDGTEFGTKQRKLKVQWAKMTEADRKRDGLKPTQTLFVVNFDHTRVTSQDLEDYFSYYGALSRVQIKKNFAFVEFLQLEDSIKAFDACNGKVFKGRTITIEYTQNSGAAAAPRAPPPERRNDDRRYERERSPPPRKRSRSPVYDRDRDYDRRPVPSYSSRDPPPRAEYRSSRYEERDRYDDRNRSPPRRSSHYSPPRRYSPPRNTRRY